MCDSLSAVSTVLGPLPEGAGQYRAQCGCTSVRYVETVGCDAAGVCVASNLADSLYVGFDPAQCAVHVQLVPVRRNLVTKLVRGIQRMLGGLERARFLIVVRVAGGHGLLIHHCADGLTVICRDAASYPE